jgi:predicted RNA binding protein YcfA (HicA-like mRNA interferase family)
MPRLCILSASEVCDILQQHGFAKSRQSGSHIVMRKQTTDIGRTVIVPNHSEIRRGTLKSIIEQSGLSRDLFMTR